MKKLIMLLAIAAFITQAKAQEMKMTDVRTRDVPGSITTAFGNAYADARDVEWSMEGNYYVAEFDQPNSHHDMYVVYDKAGKVIQTRQRISRSDVPAAIITYLKNTYDEDEMRKAYKVTDANGTVTYKGRVKGNWLSFDSSGNLLKQENKL